MVNNLKLKLRIKNNLIVGSLVFEAGAEAQQKLDEATAGE